ncbi:MAG: VCBS repeat-containing protein [Myxococcales bacterium]|nr:VCBS repeat-containing protein [Myxococcales bacterium]
MIAVLPLVAGACGELLPVVELEPSTSGGTTTASDSSGSGTRGPSSSSTGLEETSGTATTLADSDASTGVPSGCGDGVPVPGEICFGEPVEIDDLAAAACIVEIGDVVHDDGDPELLVVPCGQTSLHIYAGGPAGPEPEATVRELAPSVAATAVRSMTLGDFSGDGRLDVVIPDSIPQVAIYTDLEPDPAIVGYGMGTASYFHVLAGDFGDDANPDLLAASAYFAGIVIFQGTGDIESPLTVSQMLAPMQPEYEAEVADLDLDGYSDLVLSTRAEPYRLEVFAGISGGLATTPQYRAVPQQVSIMATGQLDGRPGHDLVTLDAAGDVAIHPLSGSVTLGDGQVVSVGPGEVGLMATIDLDGDELDDLVTTQLVDGDHYLVLSTNVGGTSFEPRQMVALDLRTGNPDDGAFLRVADLDRDGIEDIVVVTTISRILLLLSDP